MNPNPYEAPNTNATTPRPDEQITRTFFAAGVTAMLCALFIQNMTLTSNSYREALVIAVGLTAIADACLFAVVWRGPHALRLLALAAMSPTLFVIADFIRRAPHVF